MADEVWDTCCVLNLIASGQARAVLRSRPGRVYVIREAMRSEALYVYSYPSREELLPADWEALVADRLIGITDVAPSEAPAFVQFSERLGDGEARCLAVAEERGMTLVTDDRRTIATAQKTVTPVRVVTTPEWAHHWALSEHVPPSVLREAILRIRASPRYDPPPSHPLASWWHHNLE
ncbi:MAG: PIN domain-containing protein [Armatimonadetes bacterium]|nr:PIN domain-containing protein [Armatimonadota bacterium]